jgi:hypothetical protein
LENKAPSSLATLIPEAQEQLATCQFSGDIAMSDEIPS